MQIQIQRLKYRHTNTQIEMTKYKYKDTDAQIQKTHTQNHMSASKLS